MKKWIFRPLAILLAVLFCSGAGALAQEPEEPRNLYARSAVLLDGGSGRVLFGKDEDEVLPNASTTKIMTCILALENCDGREVAAASANAASQPEVHLGVQKGETFYLEDLLYSLMLESHNDSAVVIAEHVGGSVEQFAAMMNEKARALGCGKTHFVTPNGLDASDAGGAHGTTAAELARIMAYCVRESPAREKFLHITQTRSYSFSNTEGTRSFSCQNHNAFLDIMQGVISGKTGFTSAAGYCYVGALERDGRLFVVALLACGWPYNRNYKWSDAKALMKYGLENYQNHVIQITESFDPIPVEDGIAGDQNPFREAEAAVAVDATGRGKHTYLLREDEKVRSRVTIKKSLLAPVEEGTAVGKIGYYLGEELLEEYPIVTTCRVEARNFSHWFRWVYRKYML